MGEKRPNPESDATKNLDNGKEVSDEPRKLFIGGLTRNTTIDAMKHYFGFYGKVIDSIIMIDDDGSSRGFGFVTFEDSDSVEKVLQHKIHFLDGKQVDVKRSVPKDKRPPPRSMDTSKKAFLGGLPTDMTEEDLKEFFSIYGQVTDCVIMYDEKTLKSRGFGFIGFDDETVIDKLLKQQHIQIRHKQVEIKLARPRSHPNPFSGMSAAQVLGYGGSGGGHGQGIGPRMPAGPYGQPGGDYSSYGYGGGSSYGSGPIMPQNPPAKRMRGLNGPATAINPPAQQQQQPPQGYAAAPYGGGGYGNGSAPPAQNPQPYNTAYPGYDPNYYANYYNAYASQQQPQAAQAPPQAQMPYGGGYPPQQQQPQPQAQQYSSYPQQQPPVQTAQDKNAPPQQPQQAASGQNWWPSYQQGYYPQATAAGAYGPAK